MVSLANMSKRVESMLYGAFPTESPFVTTLTATYTDAEGVIDVLDGTQWAVNDVVENTATGEQMKVLSVNADILTVVHGWAGTPTAAAVTASDVLYKNPRFSQQKISDSIQFTLYQLEDWGVHGFSYGTITRADPKTFYELDDNDILNGMGVLKMYVVSANSEIPVPLPFRYHHSLGTGPTEFTNGQGVMMGNFGPTSDGDTIHYVYAQRLTDVGELTPHQEELVEMGTTAKVLGASIIPATHDPGARTDRTTQPGQTSRDVRYFQGQFIQMARTEAAHLSVERQKMLTESVRQARARRWVN